MSILLDIKKLLGIDASDTDFDQDLIININSVIFILRQIGVGPQNGYSITGSTETWENYLGNEISKLEAVKTYIYLKTRLIFDPPASSTIKEANEKMINELEFRLNLEIEEQGG